MREAYGLIEDAYMTPEGYPDEIRLSPGNQHQTEELAWGSLGTENLPMSLFTSDRERRLWLWTLAVVVAIYSTLGLTRTLAGALRDSGLLGAAFALGMLLVGATIVMQG